MVVKGKVCFLLENKKRAHHYVFQAYLKNWANANEKLWCLREGKVFEAKTKNVAFKKDFYRVQPLNQKEIEFIKLFFHKYNEPFRKEVDKFIELYTSLDKYKKVFLNLRTLFPNECPRVDEAMREIDNMIDVARNNLTEDTFAEFEGEAVVWLNALCDENISFIYDSNDVREKFINFVCMQYYRTLSMSNNILSVLKEAENYFVNEQFPKGCIKAENLVFPMLWIISARCADVLLKSPITLIVNKTSTAFITSDQPIINLKADYKNLKSEVSDLIFYYPISPNIAVLVNDHSGKTRIELKTDEDVEKYNNAIKNASNKMIFSNSSKILEKYNT